MVDRIPVTLLTGFLGSGKSTLLARVLRDPRFSDTAVVVNEFGEVGLDGLLVAQAPDQVVEMTTGCLCCTIRGDIRDTLLRLAARATAGEIPVFARLVVETTGLADPAPVIQTLIGDARVARRFALAGVVTVVDAVNGADTLARHDESVRQVAVADRIVLSKTDLARDPVSVRDVARLRADLARRNPGALLLEAADPGLDLRFLVDMTGFEAAARGPEVRAWLNAEAIAAAEDHTAQGHGHHGHHHDVNRHGSDIEAFTLVLDEPVGTLAFTTALEVLARHQGPQLLRIKGIVHLRERPDTPVVIHGVQHVFHDPVILDRWPDTDRRTRLVFITQGIAKPAIEAFFHAWQDYSAVEDGPAVAPGR